MISRLALNASVSAVSAGCPEDQPLMLALLPTSSLTSTAT